MVLTVNWGENWPSDSDLAWGDGFNPQSNADFRDLNKNLATLSDDKRRVRLSDVYLKCLIVDMENGVVNGQQSDINDDNTGFSNWGKYNEESQCFEGGDADKSSIMVQIGTNYSDKDNISQNENYMIDTVSPSNVKLDLFDYWLFDQYYYDQHGDSPIDKLVSSGVNNERALLFRKSGGEGTWNAWTNSSGGARQGIVKNKLNNETKYPDLNIANKFQAKGEWSTRQAYNVNEDLSYLFDVNEVNFSNYGKGYSDVKGLFKINEDGNYYYSSHDNFAEYDFTDNSFNVYNTWGVKNSGTSPAGQFYPFNSADEVFDIDANGSLQTKNLLALNNVINHYLGLTMEVDFQQPVDGMVSVGANGKPMLFEFSGDDDVWIFIDGVLVADLGGIHDEMSVSIDFSTGSVDIQRVKNPSANTTIHTTIKNQFEVANVSTANFNGDTFGDNTTHTLKMFYLERGNTDSNLTLSFNLMEPVENEIIKLDQNGLPVQNAKFDLYVANTDENGMPILKEDNVSYEVSGDPIISELNSDENGRIVLSGEYDYSAHDYYVLKETAPTGYFSPGDILLRYDRFEKHPDGTSSGTNLLMVENRWETGAVASFTAKVYQSGTLKYDNTDFGTIDNNTGKNGLILAVPMLKGSDGNWFPLYGSNIVGFNSVKHDNSTSGQRRAILQAALYQIYASECSNQEDYDYPKWYLEWSEENGRYQGTLKDLPGDASRYYWASGVADSDLTMSYYFLDLSKLDLEGYRENMTTEEKYDLIYNTIITDSSVNLSDEQIDENIETLADRIMNINGDEGSTAPAFALLDVGDFNRVFASRIYIANIQPQLNVQKLDENGNPIEGVEFTLYLDENCSTEVATGTTDENGMIYFSAASGIKFKGNTNYWLKETKGPEGYVGNDAIIPVYVTSTGRVYADALEENDGITVKKGLGKLLQTMVKYAGNGDINATLRDITAKLFTVESFSEIGSAITNDQSSDELLNLHYGLSTALFEYGTHEVNGVTPNPYFEVDEGIAGVIVNQNYSAHEGENLYSTIAVKTDIQDVNIRGLFTGSTTVVVRNRKSDSLGTFSIKKTVSGNEVIENASFDFSIKITKSDSSVQEEEINLQKSYSYQIYNNNGVVEKGDISFSGNATEGWKIANVKNNQSNYIVTDTNNEYVIRLKDDEMIVVNGLPFNLLVTAEEKGATDYITSISVNNGSWTVSKEASGVIEKPIGNPAFVFNNHKDKVTDLTIQKLLPEEPTSTKAFPFEITLRDQVGSTLLTGNYEWKIVDSNGSTITDSNRETSGTITDGKLVVSLKNNEKIIIKNIPVESTYIIKETTQGYSPTVTVNDQPMQVIDGAISGSLNTKDENENYIATDVVYTNTRSGSITLTKKDGQGNILSGAGFTLYSVDNDGNKTKVGNEKFTQLALRVEFKESDPNFDKDSMRYNCGIDSYVVHMINDQYCYYRFLTDSEKEAFYNGNFNDEEMVEAIVEFDELALGNYCIEETTVPQGYIQNSALEGILSEISLPMVVGEEGNQYSYYDILYTVTNHAELVLPTTGVGGIRNELTLAIGLIAIAGIGWTQRKRVCRLLSK